MSAFCICIHYSKLFKRLLKRVLWRAAFFFSSSPNTLERTGSMHLTHRQTPLQCSLCFGVGGGVPGSLCVPHDEGKSSGGLQSRLSRQPRVNRAIPPKLMSPWRLIGAGLDGVLPIVSLATHKGLYLIGSDDALGWLRDRGLQHP